MKLKSNVKRPILRYHGGKWILAPWILSHFPDHRTYVEPYGGAASILLRKRRSYAEVYNELDAEIVNLFEVVRDKGEALRKKLINTPFSRLEFELSYQPADCPIEKARRTVVRSHMGFGSASVCGRKTGFRSNSSRSGTTPAHDWRHFPEALNFIMERLRGVVIENRGALEVMKAHDSKETLHYVDPPYVKSTRHRKEKTVAYNFEMTDEQHVELCEFIKTLKGIVIISGYENDLYEGVLGGWTKSIKKTNADGARERTEVLWCNRKECVPQISMEFETT